MPTSEPRSAAPLPLRRRIGTLWPVKALGTMAGMAFFFVAYFHLLAHPARPPFEIPLTIVDRWIGFLPVSLVLYVSLWFYVALLPAFYAAWRPLLAYAAAAVGLALAGLGIFYRWPTATPKPFIDPAAHPSFAFLNHLDAAGNACPSLHAAFAVFTAVGFARLLPALGAGRFCRIANVLWCLGILHSTLATKQHVFLDLVAGTALGLLFAALHARLDRPRP